MILSDFYITDISLSSYNMTINNTVTVTVKLIDFNGQAVANKSATITVDEGYFTQNGEDTYTGTTNSSGEIVVTYKPITWGNHTFYCNGESIKVRVMGGWKSIGVTRNNSNLTTYNCHYNQDMVRIYIEGKNIPTAGGSLIATLPNLNFLKPHQSICVPCHRNAQGEIYLDNQGRLYSTGGTQNTADNNQIGFYYARRNTNTET